MSKKIFLIVATIFCFASSSIAADPEVIKLPPPDLKGGKSLMQSLQERKTSRSFSSKKLPPEVLSSLLWAACGINRPESGKRTAPSALNWQEIDVYVALEEGLYLYNAKTHTLNPILKKDLRKNTVAMLQPAKTQVVNAPVQLIYVANYSKMGLGAEEDKIIYSAVDSGFIAQNVYLYCASAGLNTVVRGMVDKKRLAKDMQLRDQQKIVLVHTVGYPQAK
ncbi:MAG: nitroreductase family protein [Smithellaceae bacterium]|jgi:SagB-type dehydrogenase family enzyme